MAKDRNTFAKRQREVEKQRKASEKRERRRKQKEKTKDIVEPGMVSEEDSDAPVD